MKNKIIKKRDKNSHHKKNYLVIFGSDGVDCLKCLVNSSEEKQALRIALGRLCREYPDRKITRARIGGIFENKKKTIEKRIG